MAPPRRRLKPKASAGEDEGRGFSRRGRGALLEGEVAPGGRGRSLRARELLEGKATPGRSLLEGEGVPGGWEGVGDQVQVSL